MTEDLATLRQRYPTAVTFRFGDSAALCADLIALVRAGHKTATCGAMRDYEPGVSLPEVGRHDIALTWEGRPALVIQTLELIPCRFDEVTEAMALAEGEDETLQGWQTSHRAYFARTGGFAPDMPVLWERFALIEDLSS